MNVCVKSAKLAGIDCASAVELVIRGLFRFEYPGFLTLRAKGLVRSVDTDAVLDNTDPMLL